MVAGLAADTSIVVPDKKLEDAGIKVIQDEVIQVDAAGKSVTLAGGDTLPYDNLYLATGSRSSWS